MFYFLYKMILCVTFVTLSSLTKATNTGTLQTQFCLTDLMLGQKTEGIPEELTQAIANAYKEENYSKILDYLEPYTDQNNPEILLTIVIAKILDKQAFDTIGELEQIADTYHHPCALLNLGLIYANGYNAQTEKQQREICAQNACFYLTQVPSSHEMRAGNVPYILGQFFGRLDMEQSKKYFLRGITEYNDPYCMWGMGVNYIYTKDYAEAKKYLHKVVDTKDFEKEIIYPEALNTLGWIYCFVEKDYFSGLPYLHQGADTYNHSVACYNLFCLYTINNHLKEAIFYGKEYIKNANALVLQPSKELHSVKKENYELVESTLAFLERNQLENQPICKQSCD